MIRRSRESGLIRSPMRGGLGALALIGGLAAMLAASSVSAQGRRGGRSAQERLESTMTELKKQLALSEEQETQVRTIYGQYYEKSAALREERRGKSESEREAYRGKRGELHDELEAQLGTVLTPEQMEKWRKYQEDRREGMRKRRGSRRGNGEGGREEGGDSPDES